MNWKEVQAHPALQDLPFKIELNEYGNIMMTPASNKHGNIQAKILRILFNLMKEGDALVECSVATVKGVKVADVAWGSDEFIAVYGFETPYQKAPELCVEVVSPSNSEREMQEKIALYLGKGAWEVWVCAESGVVQFYSYEGEMGGSVLFPDFPQRV
ncbi:MAG TPA: Uma2 family endonuclease [Anaerolineae bacterium]|nr:Uma2 family endonuclease [Anaerolineae bacterium]